ncbi:hypothetical protein FA15DRAFT_599609, partial [Coprinopsis marcescibilis]
LQKGAAAARSDNTRSLKIAVVDWITPKNSFLSLPLQCNVKTDRGFYHNRTGELLCPATMDWGSPEIKTRLKSGELAPTGDQWPKFVYQEFVYDAADPWHGLFQSHLLVQAYKHIFTSPSSVENPTSYATRSSISRLHGMTVVTAASLAYIATQVRFALSSTQVFSRNDTVTDSERFYNTVLELLEDPEEQIKVEQLLNWWNK